VSSGNAHRVKEASPDLDDDKIPTGQIAAQKAITHLVATGDPFVKALQLEHKPDPGKSCPYEKKSRLTFSP